MANLISLGNLQTNLPFPAIRVKIIRKWSTKRGGDHHSVMLLGDEKGVTIEGSLNYAISLPNDMQLNEGSWVEIVNFKIKHAGGLCVAYGALVHSLNGFWRSTTADIVVCVLRLWRIEWGAGGFKYVTNFEGGSEILFDIDVPDIRFFKSQ
ncbi:ATP-dependent DNA helicase [Raphanus sativus]|nr:ATP-dependent DNA helicase [Raphanus sativus]